MHARISAVTERGAIVGTAALFLVARGPGHALVERAGARLCLTLGWLSERQPFEQVVGIDAGVPAESRGGGI